MRWHREEYLALMRFEDVGREMFCELFGPLKPLESEWRRQGASEAEIAMTAFDWDYVPTVELGVHSGLSGGTETLVSETETQRICIDRYGRRTKLCKDSATIPLPMNWPVETEADWQRIKPRYLWNETRVDAEQLKRAAKARGEGAITLYGIPGGYDELRELMGEEALSYAYYDDEDMLRDMLDTMADTAIEGLYRASEVCAPDVLTIHEDLAGKSGPLIGPKQMREFVLPYYRKVQKAAQEVGCDLLSLDSDGNITAILDDFVAGGIRCIHPFEPMAGMDMVAVRQKYGKAFAVKGGIDKFALLRGKEAIRQELEYKMQPCMRHGGTVFGLDHRIPNGVTLENYRYYVNLGRELLGLGPIQGTGWGRMAF